jgi:hypothetical protein
MRWVVLVAGGVMVALAAVPVTGWAQPVQTEVSFSNGDLQLRGFIWKPEGSGQPT